MKFKVGDTVRVDKCLSVLLYEDTSIGWSDEMRNCQGCIGTVMMIEDHDSFIAYSIRFINDDLQEEWWILEEDLTLESDSLKDESQVLVNVHNAHNVHNVHAITPSKVVKLRRVDYEYLLEQLNLSQQNLLCHFVETFEEQQ